jgi:hypothetical protein
MRTRTRTNKRKTQNKIRTKHAPHRYAVLLWNQYRYYADVKALATHYDGVKAYVETEITRAGGSGGSISSGSSNSRGEAGVLAKNTSTHGDWVSVANHTDGATTCSGKAALDHHANATCCLFMECPDAVVAGFYYVQQLRILAAAAVVLNRSEDIARYQRLAASAVDALAEAEYHHADTISHGRVGQHARRADTSDAGGTSATAPDPAARQAPPPSLPPPSPPPPPPRHVMGYGYQADQALALALGSAGGVVPKADYAVVADGLAADVAANGGHLSTGIFGTKVLLPALSSTGHGDTAMEVLTQTSSPSWGAWIVEHNATTLFEMWGAFDSEPPSTGTASHNHVMFASFVPWLYQTVAGVAMDQGDFGVGVLPPPPLPAAHGADPSKAVRTPTGFLTFRVRPQLLGELTSASATVVTLRGSISAGWRRSSTAVWLNVSLPVGADTPVTVPLPDGCTPARATVCEGGASGGGGGGGSSTGHGDGDGQSREAAHTVTGYTVPLSAGEQLPSQSAIVGTVVWRKGHFVPGVAGVVAASPTTSPSSAAAVTFTTGSGSYAFVATCAAHL